MTELGQSDADYVPDPQNFVIFFLLKCGTPDQWVRACSAFGGFSLPADAFDTTGGDYTSLPFPTGLPELSQAINGTFQSIEFSMSGLAPEIIRVTTGDRDLVNGARIHVGIMDLDDRLQPVGPVDWLLEAIAGWPRISRIGSVPQAQYTIALPATAAFKDRHLAPVAYWTPQGQRARSADDAFCDLTPAYSSNSTVKWPG